MSNSLSKLYSKSPVWLQNLSVSAYGLYWHRRRFGGIFKAEVNQFRDREAFSAQQWRDYQTVAMRKLLVHAFTTVQLYNERYSALGLTVDKLQHFELEDLEKLPCLTKQDLREFGTTKLVSSKREHGGSYFSSSGSTGTPVKILYSHRFHQKVTAAMEARVRNWAGVSHRTPRGMVGGRRILPDASDTAPFYRYNYFEKQTYFSAYHISRKNIADYLEGMREHRVEYMTGYALSNFLIASMMQSNNLKAPEMKAVITSSECLTPQMRKTLGDVYSCNVFDSYSGVENCSLISQHPSGDLLISPDVGITELMTADHGHVNESKEFELVCTGFLNYDQPLIRYRIGDCVSITPEASNRSGNAFPVVSGISGRVEDIVTTGDGRKMVRFHSIFTDLTGVVEGQLTQHSYSDFTVKVVANNRFSKIEEEQIVTRLKSQIGQANIKIEIVDTLKRTESGKLKAVISELNI